MSYQQRVLKDNPIGFWALDKTNFTTDSSTGIFITGSRTLNPATIGAGVITDGLNPLVCGGDAAVALVSGSTSKITISNQYNIFMKGTEKKGISLEFWMSQESSQTTLKTSILNVPGTMSLDLVDNIMTLAVVDSVNNSTRYAYVEVEQLDPQVYVVLSYSDKSFTLVVNGNSSSTLSMDSTFKFSQTSAPNIIFSTNESLPITATPKIIIDSVAIYNYSLSAEQMQNHMIWALTDKNSIAWILENDGGYISPADEHGKNENYYIFSSEADWKTGEFKNCYSDSGVLSVPYISPLIKYNEASPLSISLDSTNGLQVSNDSSLLWDNFGSNFIPSSDSIKVSVKATSPSSFLSISGFSFGQLVLRSNSDGNIEIYCPEDETIKITSSQNSSTWKDVLIYFLNNTINIKIGSASTLSYQLNSPMTSSKMRMYLGNSYILNSQGIVETSPLVGGLKNVYIYKNDNTATGTESAYIHIPLTSDYNITQKSYWYAMVLPKSQNDIVGSRIDYGSSSRYVSVYTSPDKSTWTKVLINNGEIPGVALYQPQSLFYVKVEIDTPNSSINRPNVNYIEFITYSSLYIDSRGNHFSLTPLPTAGHTYTIRPNEYNLLSRDNNLGIYFQGGGSSDPARALISPSNSYEALEFWIKINEPPSSSFKIFDIPQIAKPNIDSNMALLIPPSGNFYINGIKMTSDPTLKVGEPYHIVYELESANSSQIYLNGGQDGVMVGNSSFGLISLYKTSPFITDSDVLTHYKRYIGINSNIIVDETPIIINSQSDSAKVFAAQWATIKAAMV